MGFKDEGFKKNETFTQLSRLSIKVKIGWGVCEKDQG
ncbi:Uncharacterised protein [Cytobacillus firmus]|nr:Uncharacterised protein [Cytobacillus firmus]